MSDFLTAHQTEILAYNALKKVLDPELGINIVDMGLIYSIELKKDDILYVEMTLSSKACPLGDTIINDVNQTLKETLADKKFKVDLVWEPAWSTDMVTPEGKKQLANF